MNRYILFFLSLLLVLTNNVNAQETCGDIVTLEEYQGGIYEDRAPIENCDNPFNADELFEAEPRLFINNQEVTEDSTIEVELETPTSLVVEFDANPFSHSVEMFQRDGEDYVTINVGSHITVNGPGDYTVVIASEIEPPILSKQTMWQKILSFIVPTTLAYYYPDFYEVKVINFTIEELQPEPEVDSLVLQYAPVLYFHPDEDYFPMNVGAFIEGSALWDQSAGDAQLYSAGDLTTSLFEQVVESEDTSDYYLAYSNPNSAKSIDLSAGLDNYQDALESGLATTTVYYHKMEDSYTDSFGQNHEFIVLQYWFFYAMNNWGEHGGFNDHEGDWESVFVFLDKDTEEPKYVAFSSHHNDGDPNFNPAQAYSVRRNWSGSDIMIVNGGPVSYVSLGSHANYATNGELGRHPNITSDDVTSEQGSHLDFKNHPMFSIADSGWGLYEGKWGSDSIVPFDGKDGPLGPIYIEVGGYRRYLEPVQWAGIDKVNNTVIDNPQSSFTLPSIHLLFNQALSAGTELGVSVHDEFIDFGSNISEINLLPNFWDITSSLTDNSFSADVSFSYNQSAVETLGGNEVNLAVYHHNPETDEWEPQASVVDIGNNTVTFTTNHFSRYALGFVEEKSMDDLFVDLKQAVKSSDLQKKHKKALLVQIEITERLITKERRLLTRLALLSVKGLENRLEAYERRSKNNTSEIREILKDVKEKLQSS